MNNERGGAHIVLFALLASIFAVMLFVVSIQWMLQSANKTRSKLALDRATHAAAWNVDELEAAYGRLIWDESAGVSDFYRYLQLNFQLDESGEPKTGSHVEVAPVVHALEFVTFPDYPAVVRRSVVAHVGEVTETVRNIAVTVYGPSVIAIVEVRQNVLGRSEPIVLSSVASVRFR